MSQQRLRVPEPEGLGHKRTSSEDNLYLAVLRASEGKKDERDRVQKKTFTKWVNKHLIKAQRHISDLYEDLRDGHNLISLLEVLSGDSLPREKGRMRFHKLQNVQIALDYLRHRQVKLVNIRNDDIADGNPKLTLGLIWTIILHFQISDIQVSGQSEDMTAKEKLLLWSQRMVEGYQGLRCDNFTSSWRDGRLFNAIIHRHKPMLIDMNKVYRQTNLENLDQAFSVAERDLGVTRLLDPEDVDVPQPDEKSIITYVSSLYDAMPELQLRWQEYRELVLLLLQWIRAHTAAFEERRFPSSFEEIEILWCQFLKFKETELPAKEADKNRSKGIYQSLEGAVQAGQLKVPPGYHPLDVEKEWGKLHVAILEREKQLRSEFERLERLQRIVSKLQMEAGLCEEQLNQADALLQSDVRLLAAGKAPQRAGEVERDLDKADGMIRLLFNDVQALKDGRHPQGEQMYRRVYRLHERLVAIRTEYNLRLRGTPRHPELEDSTLRYLQDLLAWVEENQRRVDSAEWGVDLPSVEAQLGSHRGLHQSVEEFRAKIERARTDEGQLSPATRGAYRDCLGRLDLQYAKLLNSSKARLRSLESLHGFVAAATKELMWLSEKEEEEVGFDWSERNSNMAAKKEAYSALMRELELKEKKIKEIQSTGDRLLREDHPARPTVESFQAALQTQWSWILQITKCIDVHLKENAAYFQFFEEAQSTEAYLKGLQDSIRKKYPCDKNTPLQRLLEQIKELEREREKILEYKRQVQSLVNKSKKIVQLKPRNPDYRSHKPIILRALCDYKQDQKIVHKGDECILKDNNERSKWYVTGPGGVDMLVPSVGLIIPPPNPLAVDLSSKIEQYYEAILALWNQLYINMKSLVSWHYCMIDIEKIKAMTIAKLKTMRQEDYMKTISDLELHYQEFIRNSQGSEMFGDDDKRKMQTQFTDAQKHYQTLVIQLPGHPQHQTVTTTEITHLGTCQDVNHNKVIETNRENDKQETWMLIELQKIRRQMELCESRMALKNLLLADPGSSHHITVKINELKSVQNDSQAIAQVLNQLKDMLANFRGSEKYCYLQNEVFGLFQKLENINGVTDGYLNSLCAVRAVLQAILQTEDMLKVYEARLTEEETVCLDLDKVEAYRCGLKKIKNDLNLKKSLLATMKTELQKAQQIHSQTSQQYPLYDLDLGKFSEKVTQLTDRWQRIDKQIDYRLWDLEKQIKQLRNYRDNYQTFCKWLYDAKRRQDSLESMKFGDSNTVMRFLNEQKNLHSEISGKRDKSEEVQKIAELCANSIKDYELQLASYTSGLETLLSIPIKRTVIQSPSGVILQEAADMHARYIELLTRSGDYYRFLSEMLKSLEDLKLKNTKIEVLEEELRLARDANSENCNKNKFLDQNLQKYQAECSQFKAKLVSLEELKRQAELDGKSAKQNLDKCYGQIKDLNEKITRLTYEIEDEKRRRKAVEDRFDQQKSDYDQLQKARQNEKESLGWQKMESEKAIKEKEFEIERLRVLLQEEGARKREYESELAKVRNHYNEEMSNLRNKYETEINITKTTIKEISMQKEDDSKNLRNQLDRLSRENRDLKEEIVRLNDSILQTTEQRRRAEEDALQQKACGSEMLQKKQHLEIELKQVIQQRSEDNARHKQSLEEAAKTIQDKNKEI
ncbi:PREDICTED: desmoplakin, partial [Capra hircus]|uniref:desmoplakin n=1 Tax=Capra hircus TaxID=9925 RepID=UPI0008478F26